MVDIQSVTAEIRRGKTKKERKKPQGKNIPKGGHKKQLAKIHSSLNTTYSARNLGFIFDAYLTFRPKFHLFLNPANITFTNLNVSALTSVPEQPVPFSSKITRNLITVVL